MKCATIGTAIAAMLADVCAPTRVTDGEPDVVTDITVVVACTGGVRERDQWRHSFEVRIIFPPGETAATHKTRRDELTRAVTMAVDGWAPGSHFTLARPTFAHDETVTVGTTPHKATVIRHSVTEPPELGGP